MSNFPVLTRLIYRFLQERSCTYQNFRVVLSSERVGRRQYSLRYSTTTDYHTHLTPSQIVIVSGTQAYVFKYTPAYANSKLPTDFLFIAFGGVSGEFLRLLGAATESVIKFSESEILGCVHSGTYRTSSTMPAR